MGQFIFGALIGYISFSEKGIRFQQRIIRNVKERLLEADVCDLSASGISDEEKDEKCEKSIS